MKHNDYQIEKFRKTAEWLLDNNNSYRGENYGRLAAQVMSDYANGSMDPKEFTEEITENTHRYLQAQLFRQFVDTIRGWAKCYDSGKYDPRNEFAVKASKTLCDSYLGYEGAYDNALYDKIKKL